MNKIVIYCHGYGSSPLSEKVERLRAKYPATFAFELDIDPVETIDNVCGHIDDVLLSQQFLNDEESELVFVGTSLGAWYAETLAGIYGAKSILVNPCYDPANMLAKYGVPEEIRTRYTEMGLHSKKAATVISLNDEVIDFNPIMDKISTGIKITTESGNHRFNGPEWDMVVDLVDIV